MIDMAEISLKMRVGYKWWFKPTLKVMFYAAKIGFMPSASFLERLVRKGTYAKIEAFDIQKESK